jgi:hypothetical protein
MIGNMQHRPSTPDKETIAAMPPFARLGLNSISLVVTGDQARDAQAALAQASAWGFDTESKPTFRVGDVSDGPHVVQLSTSEHAWVFQLHDATCRDVVAELLAQPGVVKAGFGLGDDRRRILTKFGVEAVGVLDLNTSFSERGYRKEMGVKSAVAVLFNQRFMKSKVGPGAALGQVGVRRQAARAQAGQRQVGYRLHRHAVS